MNNEPGKGIAKKRSHDIHHVTSAKKTESITAMPCCNVECNILLPYCIFKAWSKAATVKNGSSGFSAAGIYSYNRQAIHAFAIYDSASNDTALAFTSGICDKPSPADPVAMDDHYRLPPPAQNTGFPV
ncbi:hypothetical protein TNIN_99661 [Trichonephila inaurata madagascariensis]|uniref:Uncharacterized protein n=1 Tax=Trichonephila inaurata madagascariensis TaxID=2747483 RepID=A0A8X6YAK4_9ARAC|nr:hypothetical protein TNIN_99661 [Trichonephila inaurata madagascariensis]